MYRLMIKTHNITGLKYLCITKRKDWKKYTGSGIYWLQHLKKHGHNFKTDLLYESNNYFEFLEKCLFISSDLNVVLNEEFANLVPETGYDNNDGFPNVVLWWKSASEEMKIDIYKKRSISFKNNHWTKKDNTRLISNKIKEKNILRWKELSLNERREILNNLWEGNKKFHANKKDEKYLKWKNNISNTLIKFYNNVDKKYISEKNRKARLNTSKESAENRKKKIQDLYATGKYNHIFEKMSKDRIGLGNPAAKKILWFGKLFTKMEFEKKIGKLTNDEIKKIFNIRYDCKILFNEINKNYKILICPFCKKDSKGKKPSAFSRWHFDNCKDKK